MEEYVDDGRIWCYATVESDGNYNVSYVGGGNTAWTALDIDGTTASSLNKSQYLTAGEHLLKFTISNPTTVPEGMFRNVNIYTDIYFPDTITTLANTIFNPVSASTVIHMDMTKIVSIGSSVFRQAYVVLGDLYFPNLQTIGQNAFEQHYGGSGRNILSLGQITEIPTSCFSNAPYKKRVIPATVTSIGNNALLTWDYDKILVCYAETPPTVGSQWTYRRPEAIYVPPKSVAAYKAATGWSSYASVIFPIYEDKLINVGHLSDGRWRRRLMMAASIPSRTIPALDGKIWCYYDVEDISSATRLYDNGNSFSGMEVDGVVTTLAQTYQFSSTGEHLVKFTPKNSSLSSAWQNNAKPNKVYLPSTITYLGSYTFYSNGGSAPSVFKADGLRTLDVGCFSNGGAAGLIISLPSLTSIGQACFYRSPVKEILDLGSVTSVPTFQESSLEKLVLPSTLTSIPIYFLYHCYSFRELIIYATTPPSTGGTLFSGCSNFVIKVPSESVTAYKQASGWSDFASVIQAIPE